MPLSTESIEKREDIVVRRMDNSSAVDGERMVAGPVGLTLHIST